MTTCTRRCLLHRRCQARSGDERRQKGHDSSSQNHFVPSKFIWRSDRGQGLLLRAPRWLRRMDLRERLATIDDNIAGQHQEGAAEGSQAHGAQHQRATYDTQPARLKPRARDNSPAAARDRSTEAHPPAVHMHETRYAHPARPGTGGSHQGSQIPAGAKDEVAAPLCGRLARSHGTGAPGSARRHRLYHWS